MAKKLKNYFSEYNPDIVISVHPFGTPITAYLKKNNISNCKLAVVFTDFEPHEQWLVGKEYCDYFFVSNDIMKQTLINSYGLPEEKITVTGIPLSSAFNGPFDDNGIHQKYYLDINKKLILFFGGGEFGLGQSRTVQILKSFTRFSDKYEILAVSGRNKKMYDSFIELSNSEGINNLHVVEYTTDVPGLMHIASLVVTKPGGLTSSESLASNLPIIITTPIPGQEEENAEFLVNSGAAVWIKKDDNIDEVVENVVNNEEQLHKMKSSILRIAKPNSTRDICEKLI